MNLNNAYEMPLLSLEERAQYLQERVMKDILESKRKKLIWFVRGFHVLKLFEKERSTILQDFYLWARYVDDVIDGDRPCPCSSIKNFIIQKKLLFKAMAEVAEGKMPNFAINDDHDLLLIYTDRACKEKLLPTADVLAGMRTIFETMEYDYERRQKRQIPTDEELDEYFRKLDDTTVWGALKVMGETGVTKEDLHGLNRAVRGHYNLRDLAEDIRTGLSNITTGDIRKYDIDISILRLHGDNDGEAKVDLNELLKDKHLKEWAQDQIRMMEDGLEAAQKRMKGKRIMFKTRLALWLCFKFPCRRAIRKWKPLLA